MNRYKLKLLVKEFPFLHIILDKNDMPHLTEIKIKRCDENLLAQTPSFDAYSSCDYSRDDRKDYVAITGQEITLLEAAGASCSACIHEDDVHRDADMIGEQLYELKIQPDYVVQVERWDTEKYDYSVSVVIYKMCKFDLAEYHCHQINKAAAQLKDEIRAVCGGAR